LYVLPGVLGRHRSEHVVSVEKPSVTGSAYIGPITEALWSSGETDPTVAHWLPWRTGRKVGRTIYAQIGSKPSDDDVLIGTMDLPRLAEEVVTAHNAILQQVQRIDSGGE
jgi:hypothetical protein